MNSRGVKEWNHLAVWLKSKPKRFESGSKTFQKLVNKYLTLGNNDRELFVYKLEKVFGEEKLQFKDKCRSYLNRLRKRQTTRNHLESLEPLFNELCKVTGHSFETQTEAARFALMITVKLFSNKLLHTDDYFHEFEEAYTGQNDELSDFKEASLKGKLRLILEHDLFGLFDDGTERLLNSTLTRWADECSFLDDIYDDYDEDELFN